MRGIFILLFGRMGEEVYSINVDGVWWYPASQICKLLGIKDVSYALKCKNTYFDLMDDEKCKMKDTNVNKRNLVWFVSESGFWKVLGASQSYISQEIKFWMTTRCLPAALLDLLDFQLE